MTKGLDLPPRVAVWREAGRFLTLAGRSVFLREGGAGTPLLLLHAYPTGSWGFHRVWDDLTRNYRVLAPDLPGSGLSQKGTGADYSLGTMAAVAGDLLRTCGIERPHLLAHGYGASIGQEMLAQEQVFASVTFVTAGLFPELSRLTVMQRMMLSPLGPLLARWAPQPFRAFARRLSAAFGPATQPSQEDLRAIWALLRGNGGQRSVPDVIAYLTERKRLSGRLVGALAAAEMPLHLIASADDPLSGRPVIEAWRALLPEAALSLLPEGIGHYPPLECPAALLALYRAFRQGLAEPDQT